MSLYLSKYTLINAVLENKQDGFIFSHTDTAFSWLFVLHTSGFGELTFTGSESLAVESFLTFIKQEHKIPSYFHIYNYHIPASYQPAQGLVFKNRKRIAYSFGNTSAPHTENTNNLELRLLNINDKLLLKQFNLDLWHTFWESYEKCIHDGFGILALDDKGAVCSICYAAAVAHGHAEIDILTAPEYRGRGIGKLVASAFIAESLRRHIRPSWDCFEDNLSSKYLACSLGFTEQYRYHFTSVFDAQKEKRSIDKKSAHHIL